MSIDEIIGFARGRDDALVVIAEPGGPFPEAAWGDAFFFFSPDGTVPARTQPWATVTTQDRPGDETSRLGGAGRFRVNVHVGSARADRLIDAHDDGDTDPARADVFRRHPLYGPAGWVCVVCPAERTADIVRELLHEAHENARSRARRRQGER